MKFSYKLFFPLAALFFGTQQEAVAQAADAGSGIGYPSVAVALDALKSRPAAKVSMQGGWTIIEDPVEYAIWSFAPADHPAFPSAVRRKPVQREGVISMETKALCQAPKPACDKLMAEFQALDEKIRGEIRGKTAQSPAQWSPSDLQRTKAESTLARFQLAIDEGRYADAYEMFTPGMKKMMTRERFVALESQFREESGGAAVRTETRTTWYNDPPNAAAKGVFAAFDLRTRFPNIATCAEVVILHEESDGQFSVMRKERTIVSK